jgi:glyoxylase-like metal-dependent hydrolase (beta-lactamase superfamily II)
MAGGSVDMGPTRIAVPDHDIVGIRATNAGPFTLSGTNSWLIGRAPTWLVDPGPDLAEHVAAIEEEIGRRGGLGGMALTHDHPDHAGALGTLRERHAHASVAAARGEVDVLLVGGVAIGPLEAVCTPGHSRDHLAYIAGSAAFTGDAVLGEGSVFVAPYPGAMRAYTDGIERLRKRELDVLCPGHGPLVTDPAAKLAQYLAHRREREERLVRALAAGRRGVDELLDEAWADAPAELRFAAAVTLAAHLDKLEEEGRLPEGVERPRVDGLSWTDS